MGNPIQMCGRGLRYVRQYGPAQLYRKIKERRDRNRAEAGYEDWLAGCLAREKDGVWKAKIDAEGPFFSILVPAYETPELFLRQMIESVLGQSYKKVQLCIADGSSSERVCRVAEEYREKDDRLCYEKLSENRGISENTNAALALASGDYVGFLDHDDILLPGALFEIAEALVKAGQPDAVYTDEDKVNPELTRHFQPHFKPDFNLEYLRSNNYICHFFVVRREVDLKTGGFRSGFDGAQDHDFILRCAEAADRILHVPEVLYSWRCHEASTAANPESKLYAYEAGKRAVRAHLERIGSKAEVLGTSDYGFYRLRYPQTDRKILINSFEKLDGQTGIKVVYYDKACNNSVTFPGKHTEEGQESYVLFTCIRNAEAGAGFWEEILSCCARPEVGIVCARVYDRNRRLTSDIRMAGVQDPFGAGTKGLKEGYTGYFHRVMLQQEIAVPTDCFLVREELLEGLESFTIRELCEKIRRQGYRMVYDPWAVVYERK